MSKSYPADGLVVASPTGLGLDAAASCCSPVTTEALTDAQADALMPALKGLADPVRLRLVSLIAAHEDGEACVCELNAAFDLSQPTISHHLKVLHAAGLLDRTKRGTWVYYRLRREALRDLVTLLGGPPPDQAA